MQGGILVGVDLRCDVLHINFHTLCSNLELRCTAPLTRQVEFPLNSAGVKTMGIPNLNRVLGHLSPKATGGGGAWATHEKKENAEFGNISSKSTMALAGRIASIRDIFPYVHPSLHVCRTFSLECPEQQPRQRKFVVRMAFLSSAFFCTLSSATN